MQPATRKPKASLRTRRAERELFFWTAWQVLTLLVSAAFALYSIVSMAEGHVPAIELLINKI